MLPAGAAVAKAVRAKELRLQWEYYLDTEELHEHLLYLSLMNATQNLRELFKDFEVERLLDRRQQ